MPCPPSCWPSSAGAKVVGGRHRRPPCGVGVEKRIDKARVFSAGALRCADHIRVFAQQLEVDHGRNTTFGCPRRTCRGRTPQAQPHNITTASLVTARDTPVTMERMSEAPTVEYRLPDVDAQSS